MSASPLEAACRPHRRLAVAGTCKNAGKTTAFNHLIARFHAGGERLGLTSVGRDGEAIDQVTNHPKPRVHPPVGSLVATAEEAAGASRAGLRLVAPTRFRTAIGMVGIYEVQRPGHVELAGPVKVREAAALMGQLEGLGAQRVLLDGAADRRAFVSCGVDAFVLATGLALEPDPEALAEATAAILARLQLPAPPPELAPLLALGDRPGALTPQGLVEAPFPTFLAEAEAIAAWLPPDALALHVPGAAGDALMAAFLARPSQLRPPALVVPSGTHLLAEAGLWARYVGRGGKAYGHQPLLAAALTVNPTSPEGSEVAVARLLKACQAAMPALPVVDVLAPGLATHA